MLNLHRPGPWRPRAGPSRAQKGRVERAIRYIRDNFFADLLADGGIAQF